MNWLPIIVTLCIVGFIFVFILLPLVIFACIKSVQRREEKVERREIIQRSLHASKCSLNSLGGAGMSRSVQSLRSVEAEYQGADDYRKRRPLIHPNAFLELDDVTLDDTTTDRILAYK
jgi:hypothetical protein